MIDILHVIQQLSAGGASRALVALAAASTRRGSSSHRALSLAPATSEGRRLAETAGLAVIDAPDPNEEARAVVDADIVHVHFWNTPELYAFIVRCRQPMRTVLWCDVSGATTPHVLSANLVRWADTVVMTSAISLDLPVIQSVTAGAPPSRVRVVMGAADFGRLGPVAPQPHDGFVVGYVGLVDPIKLHPRFVRMSARVRIPDVRFVVCGSGSFAHLVREADEVGATSRFEFRGYVENVAAALSIMDVFGYPLTPDSSATSDLALQEAMYAGVPPVVLGHGGVSQLVAHDRTGLVVQDDDAYVAAIEFLYAHPDERRRMATAAAAYARSHFGADRTAEAMADAYRTLARQPKRLADWHERGASAAERFAHRLGDRAPEFHLSLDGGSPVADRLAAETRIGAAGPALTDAASGGILHYRRAYPNDPMLRLWAGLVFEHAHRPALAAAEYVAAERQGCPHWRVSWYLARAASKAGSIDLARRSLTRVLAEAPEFEPARVLAARLEDPSR
jgi:glycosyltransferase involved in cell wall biosynthesis